MTINNMATRTTTQQHHQTRTVSWYSRSLLAFRIMDNRRHSAFSFNHALMNSVDFVQFNSWMKEKWQSHLSGTRWIHAHLCVHNNNTWHPINTKEHVIYICNAVITCTIFLTKITTFTAGVLWCICVLVKITKTFVASALFVLFKILEHIFVCRINNMAYVGLPSLPPLPTSWTYYASITVNNIVNIRWINPHPKCNGCNQHT